MIRTLGGKIEAVKEHVGGRKGGFKQVAEESLFGESVI